MIDAITSATMPIGSSQIEPTNEKHDALKKVADDFEAVFIAEMLSHTSIGKTSDTFGGGVGEDAFGSMLTREWADQVTKRGGLGVADAIYQSLLARGGRDV